MKYRLFISDFDGTLVRADGTISENNKRAIEAYRVAGGIFAIATGRMLNAIRPRLCEVGLDEGLVVAFQGMTIMDIGTGKLLKNSSFSEEDALHAIRYLEGEGLHIHIYTVDEFYSNMDDAYLHEYENTCGVKAKLEEDLFGFVEREHPHIVKLVLMVHPTQRVQLYEKVKKALGERYFVTCSTGALVEIMPMGESKAAAVRYLSEYYQIPVEHTAAIGDQLNDLPMLEAAGGRFAVANAEESLKNCATVVASCEEDGVAEAIGYAMGD